MLGIPVRGESSEVCFGWRSSTGILVVVDVVITHVNI